MLANSSPTKSYSSLTESYSSPTEASPPPLSHQSALFSSSLSPALARAAAADAMEPHATAPVISVNAGTAQATRVDTRTD
eukprot:6178414-Pleurochrysis_carterae.AAC.7